MSNVLFRSQHKLLMLPPFNLIIKTVGLVSFFFATLGHFLFAAPERFPNLKREIQ